MVAGFGSRPRSLRTPCAWSPVRTPGSPARPTMTNRVDSGRGFGLHVHSGGRRVGLRLPDRGLEFVYCGLLEHGRVETFAIGGQVHRQHAVEQARAGGRDTGTACQALRAQRFGQRTDRANPWFCASTTMTLRRSAIMVTGSCALIGYAVRPARTPRGPGRPASRPPRRPCPGIDATPIRPSRLAGTRTHLIVPGRVSARY
jgi:hypothetical protein